MSTNPSTPELPSKRRHRIGGAGGFFLYFLLIGLITAVLFSAFMNFGVSSEILKKSFLIAVLPPVLAAALASYMITQYSWGEVTAETLLLRRISLKQALTSVGVGVALFLGLQAVSLVTSSFLKMENSKTTQNLASTAGWERWTVMLLMVPIIVPFFEELFFRGVIYNNLRHAAFNGVFGRWAPSVFSSAAFAFMHVQGWSTPNDFIVVAWIFICGLVNCWLVKRGNSVVSSWISHMVYNGASVAVLLLAAS